MTSISKCVAGIVLWSASVGMGMGSAQSRPDCSGTWKLNVPKSDFGNAPPLRSLEVKVEKCDSVLKYTVTGTDADGNAIEDALEVAIDGNEHEIGNGQGIVRLKWQGPVLVGENRSADGGYVQQYRVTTSSDGKAMIRDVQVKSAGGDSQRKEVYDKQ